MCMYVYVWMNVCRFTSCVRTQIFPFDTFLFLNSFTFRRLEYKYTVPGNLCISYHKGVNHDNVTATLLSQSVKNPSFVK